MEKNNIIASLESNSFENLYQIWQNTHVGSLKDFYRFMTKPSVNREKFINSLDTKLNYSGNVVIEMILV